MESPSVIEGAVISFVGAALVTASFFVRKKPPAALACILSGTLLCSASQPVSRLELWTGSLVSISNQIFLFSLSSFIVFMIWQAWNYAKLMSPPPKV